MKYIIANWKMNMNLETITKWMETFSEITKNKVFKNKLVISAPAPYLYLLREYSKTLPIICAAQDISVLEKGAHTGQVGAFEIKDFCDYTVVGHSETKDTLEITCEKRDMALKNGLIPFVCFVDPSNIDKVKKEDAILVWEDPANISKNGVYNAQDPKIISDTFNQMKTAHPQETILYGGSVNPENAETLSKIDGLMGAIIGNASLDPKQYLKIASAFE